MSYPLTRKRLHLLKPSARNASTISQYFCGACSNIGCVVPGIISVREPATLRCQRVQHLRQRALGVGATDEQRRRLDRLGIRFRERRARVAGLADQRGGVVAQQLLRRGRQALPGAGTFQRIHEDLEPAIDIALGDDRGGGGNPGRERRGAGLVAGSSVASSSPPGSARISLRSKSGRRCATRNEICPPREWPIRSTGPASSFSMKPITSSTCCAIE